MPRRGNILKILFTHILYGVVFFYANSAIAECADDEFFSGSRCRSCSEATGSPYYNKSVLPRTDIADCYQYIGRKAGYYYDCTSECGDKNKTCQNYDPEGKLCSKGSYCTGNEFYVPCGMPLGIKGCPSDYPSSHPGAESINDCYKGCPDVTVPKGSQAKFLCSSCPTSSNITKCGGTGSLAGWYCPGDNTVVEVYYGKKNIDWCYVHEAQKCPSIGSLNQSMGWGVFVISGNSTYVFQTRVQSYSGASSLDSCYYKDISDALMVYRKDDHGFFKAGDQEYLYKTDTVDGSEYSGYTGIHSERKVAQKCAKYTDKDVTYYYGIDGNNCTKCISPYTDQIYASVPVTGGIGIIQVSKTNETEVTFTDSGCTYNVPAGSYIEKAKDTKDTACPAGYKCPGGAVVYGNTGKKEACPSGTYSAAGASSCTQCVANTYNSSSGSDKCTPCSGGQSSKTGASKCSSCNSEKNAVTWKSWGTWKSDNTLSGGDYGGGCGVAECNAGEIGNGAKSADVSISGETGQTSCVYTGTCLAGYYNPTAAGSDTAKDLRTITCSQCPKGRYCEEDNASKDGESCPGDYPESAAGSSSINDCYLTTAAGKWVAEKTAAQTDCPAGYYCPGGIQVKYGVTGGATACPAGTYRSKTGAEKATDCTKCSAGTYSDKKGATTDKTCTKCPNGTYNPDAGSTALSACKACPKGKYNPDTGSTAATACKECPKGTYNATTGQGKCTFCAAGKTTTGTGNDVLSSCIDCLTDPDNSYVEDWVPHSWKSGSNYGEDAGLCIVQTCKSFSGTNFKKNGIANASITPNDNKTKCIPSVTCSPGWHTPTPTATEKYTEHPSCTGCAAGYYCTGDGKEIPCDKDKYSEATAAECLSCDTETNSKYPKSDGTTGTKGKETTLANSKEKCYVELESGKYVKDKKMGWLIVQRDIIVRGVRRWQILK